MTGYIMTLNGAPVRIARSEEFKVELTPKQKKKKGDVMIDTSAEGHLNQAVECEVKNIKEVYGRQYSSLHEGYAVLLKEVEEAESELKRVKEELEELWTCIKQNDNKGAAEALRRVQTHAYFMLTETTQINAVTQKFRGK